MLPVLAALLLFSDPILNIPHRNEKALTGTAFANEIESLKLQSREERIETEVLAGNLPTESRTLVPVEFTSQLGDRKFVVKIFVSGDYLSVGSDSDKLYTPLTPYTAQRIANKLHCILPTPTMVDAIYKAAQIKLAPSPIPPSPAMTTVPIFLQHSQTIATQRQGNNAKGLVAGHKKDVVITAKLPANPGKVAIYGWHKLDGAPIQPLYLGHTATWVDYSHGIRLVSRTIEIDGKRTDIRKVLADPELCQLLSNEGPITQPHYSFAHFPKDGTEPLNLPKDETLTEFSPIPSVRVVIHAPAKMKSKVRLVIYALPNGNTIEQTFGRKIEPGMDWHFDIQHIGAQTRFLRSRFPDESLVVAYVANANLAWPAWLRSHDPALAKDIMNSIIERFKGQEVHVALNSHSGGGALLFAYIKTVEKIPDLIDRIAFLDSEYAYDSATHSAKLVDWLKAGLRSLCVIAYDDANALYEGKPFVSAEGGTWGRSHAMLRDLQAIFAFKSDVESDPEKYTALDGRVEFLLKRNPKREIYHTVQVERNGFIHSMLHGTPLAGLGYEYFGSRAYSKFIRE